MWTLCRLVRRCWSPSGLGSIQDPAAAVDGEVRVRVATALDPGATVSGVGVSEAVHPAGHVACRLNAEEPQPAVSLLVTGTDNVAGVAQDRHADRTDRRAVARA